MIRFLVCDSSHHQSTIASIVIIRSRTNDGTATATATQTEAHWNMCVNAMHEQKQKQKTAVFCVFQCSEHRTAVSSPTHITHPHRYRTMSYIIYKTYILFPLARDVCTADGFRFYFIFVALLLLLFTIISRWWLFVVVMVASYVYVLQYFAKEFVSAYHLQLGILSVSVYAVCCTSFTNKIWTILMKFTVIGLTKFDFVLCK